MKMADLFCVELALGVTCQSCREVVPVNGPRPSARCQCGGETRLEGALKWAELLTVRTPPVDVFKTLAPAKDGAVEQGARDRVTLTATRAWPRCACGRRYEGTKLAGAFAAAHTSCACPTCKKDLAVARPPASFRAGAPSVVAVVGATIVPDGPQQPNQPLPAIAKAITPWWAMFDRTLAR